MNTSGGPVRPEVELHIPEGHHRGEQMSLAQRAFYRFVWLLVHGIGRTYFRLRVTGQHNVPRHEPYILAPSHRSNLDTPIVAAVTRRRLRYMGKESVWKNKAGGWFVTSLGGFPVKRGTADREAIRACIEVLDRGEPLVVFPEGTRQSGPRVVEMKDGTAYLASRAQVPVVPVGIAGTEAAMGKGTTVPRPAKVTIVVGEPLAPPSAPEGGRVPRHELRAFTERLRDAIQVVFDQAQQRSGSS